MDWDGLLAELPPAEARRLKEAGIPPYAQLWAAGFLLAVEHWEDDWTLPADSKDEAFVDEVLDPFYVLAAPLDELTPRRARHPPRRPPRPRPLGRLRTARILARPRPGARAPEYL